MSEFIELEIPDHAYEAARNAFIHRAEVKANRNFGKTFKKGDSAASLKWAAGWNKCFASEMERLVDESGIRNL